MARRERIRPIPGATRKRRPQNEAPEEDFYLGEEIEQDLARQNLTPQTEALYRRIVGAGISHHFRRNRATAGHA